MIKPVSPSSMKLKDETLFMGRHAPTLEARVEVVDPAQPAALACPVEPCMEIQRGRGKQEENWLEKLIHHVAT